MPRRIPARLVSAVLGFMLLLATAAARDNRLNSPLLDVDSDTDVGISGNPAADNEFAGTGWLGRTLGIPKDSGVTLGGLWLGDVNYLAAGGAEPGRVSFNSLVLAGLKIDFEQLAGLRDSLFGAQFLRYDGQETNQQAGSVQGYNSIEANEPLTRTELYQLWWRQGFFDRQLYVRVGKSVPTYDFGNILRPIPVDDSSLHIPSISGLLYTPIFVNPSTLGVMPGYYDSAYGITVNWLPNKRFYISYGVYDGSLAQGVNTGNRVLPEFSGAYLQIAEAGCTWQLHESRLLGRAAVGGWYQSGDLAAGGVTEDGTAGVYLFGSQTVWQGYAPSSDGGPLSSPAPGLDPKDMGAHEHEMSGAAPPPNQGIVVFGQFGLNDSETLPVRTYAGGGVTAFSLVPSRMRDSFGAGVAASWLNPNLFARDHEWMLQAYYQAHIAGDFFLQPAVTFIPEPGAAPDLDAAWALTLRATLLF